MTSNVFVSVVVWADVTPAPANTTATAASTNRATARDIDPPRDLKRPLVLARTIAAHQPDRSPETNVNPWCTGTTRAVPSVGDVRKPQENLCPRTTGPGGSQMASEMSDTLRYLRWRQEW